MLLPVLVVTRQAVLEHLDKLVIVDITKMAGVKDLFIDQVGNLPLASFVQAENLNTIPSGRMKGFSGTLDRATMRRVSRKLVPALGLQRGGGTD